MNHSLRCHSGNSSLIVRIAQVSFYCEIFSKAMDLQMFYMRRVNRDRSKPRRKRMELIRPAPESSGHNRGKPCRRCQRQAHCRSPSLRLRSSRLVISSSPSRRRTACISRRPSRLSRGICSTRMPRASSAFFFFSSARQQKTSTSFLDVPSFGTLCTSREFNGNRRCESRITRKQRTPSRMSAAIREQWIVRQDRSNADQDRIALVTLFAARERAQLRQ